jgi:hypothetical protein
MITWNLVCKTYKDEIYETKVDYLGQQIQILVRMSYHTYLHYWDLGMEVIYSSKDRELGCVAGWIKTDKHKTRRQLRAIANQWMEEFDIKEVDANLDDWYKERIQLKD